MTALFSESHVDIFGIKFVEKYDKCSLIIYLALTVYEKLLLYQQIT